MRLGLGFALVLIFLVAVTTVGIFRMAQIQDRLDHVVSVNNVVTRLVIDMRNIYESEEMTASGFVYHCIGRPTPDSKQNN